jgi:N-acyl-D-aspartate/D-glutamate deacylase
VTPGCIDVHSHGREGLEAQLNRAERSERYEHHRRGGAAALQISRFTPDPALEGQTIADLARTSRESPEEVALDLLARGGAGLVSFNMSERDIEQIMKQPFTMTSTDGDLVPMGEGKPHPRAYGAFPRKLRLYVRERRVLDWPSAIRSMTHLPPWCSA